MEEVSGHAEERALSSLGLSLSSEQEPYSTLEAAPQVYSTLEVDVHSILEVHKRESKQQQPPFYIPLENKGDPIP